MIEFDPEKDADNRAKHGISLAFAEALLAGPTVETPDDRFDYGEVRMLALGLIEGREFACVYTMHDEVFRIISLRRATRSERNAFYKALAGEDD